MADCTVGRFGRRGLLGAGAGAGGALVLGLPNTGCGAGTEKTGAEADLADSTALIPRERRGIQLHTVRDAIGRAPSGYPPPGSRQVFEALAESGYATIEGFNDGREEPSGVSCVDEDAGIAIAPCPSGPSRGLKRGPGNVLQLL